MKKRPPQPPAVVAPDPHGLSPKQRAFVEQYLVDANGTQAAIRAGYAARSAHVTAARLLTEAKVKAALAESRGARRERLKLDGDKVLRELCFIAHIDPADCFDAEGSLLPVPKMPKRVRRAISSIEVDAKGKVRVRFWSKEKALELLGKSKDLQLFSDKVQHEAGESLLELLHGSMRQGSGK